MACSLMSGNVEGLVKKPPAVPDAGAEAASYDDLNAKLEAHCRQ